MTVDAKIRHQELHKAFDELFACFITQHPMRIGFLDTPLKDFIEWSHQMTINPTCEEKHNDEKEGSADI